MMEERESASFGFPPSLAPASASIHIAKPQSELAFSSIPATTLAITNLATRNVTSTYKWLSSSSAKKTSDSNSESFPEMYGKVVVIHPSSATLKIGLCSQVLPHVIPNVVARRSSSSNNDLMQVDDSEAQMDHIEPDSELEVPESESEYNEDQGEERKISELRRMLRSRFQLLKKRSIPNAVSTVASFNSNVQATFIADHNDAFKIEWTETRESRPSALFGKEALRIDPSEPYKLFYPFRHRRLNYGVYGSTEELMRDVQDILTHALESDLGIPAKEFRSLSAVLVIPDLFDQRDTGVLIRILFNYMGFKGVSLVQESVGATFGTGVSTALVIDMGATSISVSCIEDGFCIPNSRLLLPMGGEQVTLFFHELLKRSEFPYSPCKPNVSTLDFELLNEMKERFCTLCESDLNVNLYDFYVRRPGTKTRAFQFKTYDEVYLAPMSLLCFPHFYGEMGLVPESCLKESNYLYDDPEDYLGIMNEERCKYLRKVTESEDISGTARSNNQPTPLVRDEEEVVVVAVEDNVPQSEMEDKQGISMVVSEEVKEEPINPLEKVSFQCLWDDGLCPEDDNEFMGLTCLLDHVESYHLSNLNPLSNDQTNDSQLPFVCIWGNDGGGREGNLAEGQSVNNTSNKSNDDSSPSPIYLCSGTKHGLLSRISELAIKAGNAKIRQDGNIDHPISTTDMEDTSTAFILPKLEEAIVRSVESLLAAGMDKGSITERMKRQFQSILLIGGSSKFPGLPEFLESRLRDYYHRTSSSIMEKSDADQITSRSSGGAISNNIDGVKMDWIGHAKDVDPTVISWIGASVTGKIAINPGCEDDLWISREEWANFGFKIVQAKSLFQVL